MTTMAAPNDVKATRPGAPALDAAAHARGPAPYMNPYVAGFGLGLVLLASYVIMGRGLGASGAISSLVSWGVHAFSPTHAEGNTYFREYLDSGLGHPLKSWLVFEVFGVLVGGFVSGLLARRVTRTVEKGPRIGVRGRLLLAFSGGALMGFGARLARGCTSGQGLTGGAALNAGSWAFMMMVFAGAYLFARVLRRQWT